MKLEEIREVGKLHLTGSFFSRVKKMERAPWSWLRGLFQQRPFVGTHTEVPLVIPSITEEQWCQSC